MADLPAVYYKQGIKVKKGEHIEASLMALCSDWSYGNVYIQIYDDTNGASLDKESLAEATADWVQLTVSAVVPAGCTNIQVRYGFEDIYGDDTFYVDKIRVYRDGAVVPIE